MSVLKIISACFVVMSLCLSGARAEILAMMSYESKSPDSLKSLKLSGNMDRKEGIVIMDVDPASDNFGQILWDMPLPNDLIAHHIFYDRTMTKGYITSLGKSELGVLDMKANPIRRTTFDVPNCVLGEDVTFNEDNSRWYLTCMASSSIIVGDVKTDKVIDVIKIPGYYPHGLAINTKINRILATSTINGDRTKPGEVIVEIDATSHKILGTHKISLKPSPSGSAPVEVVFMPGEGEVIAYVTGMYGSTLWTLTWDKKRQTFKAQQVFDFATVKAGVPLEVYFSQSLDKMYVTSANPGFLHIFDMTQGRGQPKLLKTLKTGQGSHHIAFTNDGKWGIVQNSLLNLPGMSEGTLNVVDLKTEKVVATITTLADMGLNPNVIVLMPDNNNFAGH